MTHSNHYTLNVRSPHAGLGSFLLAALIVALVAVGCGDSESRQDRPLRVVATTGMIADAATNIFGDSVEVLGLMGPGVDPHLYKASRGDLTALDEADIILYNGLHLEGKMGDVLEKLRSRKPVIAVAELVDETHLMTPADYEGAFDPHIWFDVALWADAVERLADTVRTLGEEGRIILPDDIKSRSAEYVGLLRSLDQRVRLQISSIDSARRVLVTAHDAFGYFGRAYRVEVRGLQGISTVSEFGLADRNAVIAMVVERRIPAIFVESSVPRRTVDAIVEGVSQKGGSLVVGGELFSDAMGEAGTPEGTYIGMVEHNVRTIVDALGGSSTTQEEE